MAVPLRRIMRLLYPDRFSRRGTVGAGKSSSLRRRLLGVILVIVLLKVGFLLFYYNTFLSMQYDVEESQAQVDTQLQRRKNIVLSLGLLVRDYAKHEKEIFTHTTDARKDLVNPGAAAPPSEATPSNQAGGTSASEAPAGLDALLSKSDMTSHDLDALLSKVFAIAEQYPSLRLSESFQRFMDALVDAEDKIAEQRMIYNRRANTMSTEVGKFPGFLFAKLFGFETPEFFMPDVDARKAPSKEYLTP